MRIRLQNCLIGLVVLLTSPSLACAEQQRVAVFVGVNVYPKPGFSALQYAERDVELAAAEFRKLGFTTIVMKGSLAETDPLRATRKNIVDQIQALMKPLDGDDVCVVMLSGHGHQYRPEGQEAEDAFYCPVDAVKNDAGTMLSLSYVIDTLLDPHVGHKLLLVDACRDEPKASGSKGIQGSDKISLPSKTAVFFSCSAKEQSFETDKLGGGMGTFAYCLLDGLRGSAMNTDGLLTWTSLVAHVENRMESQEVRRLAPRQNPVMAGNAGRVVLGRRSATDEISEGSRAGEVRSFTDSGVKFCWCPAGSFRMGSPPTEADRSDNESPVDVTLTQGFWLGQTEVTQGQWESVMESRPWLGKEFVREGATYPAVYVNWDDATSYCVKLTEREQKAGKIPSGWSYRLPSEAEWEYACRAGTRMAFSFGEDAEVLDQYAWFNKKAGDVGANYAHTVGQKKPNAWGLHDLQGNVWEWCGDWYDAKLSGGRDPQGPSGGSRRVYRGGSWLSSAWGCRSAYRGGFVPSIRNSSLGFRVALSPSEDM